MPCPPAHIIDMNRALLIVGWILLWTHPVFSKDKTTVLYLGDSYTIGESVPESARWPALLAARLKLPKPQIIAKTGWTVAELDAAIDATKPVGPYAMVTLLIGVNDQYRGGSAADYKPAFRALLTRAVGFAGGDASKVLVVSIPDYGRTPFGAAKAASIGPEIDAFNAVNKAEAAKIGARYVDITPASRWDRPDWVAKDGLHPSGAQYIAWTDAIEPVAKVLLSP